MEIIRQRSSAIGAGLIGVSALLLIGLRFVTSPIARRIMGAEGTPVGVVPFLGIPILLSIAAIGILLLLWEPGKIDRNPDDGR